MGREKCEGLMRAAYERGIRRFDLADLYGTHPFVISALKNIPRKDFTIISKIWFRPGGIPEKGTAERGCLCRTLPQGTHADYLDLVLLHCVESGKWPEELQKQMDILAKLKKEGLPHPWRFLPLHPCSRSRRQRTMGQFRPCPHQSLRHAHGRLR